MIQSIKLKKWHKDMKKNNPKEYYLLQYNRFKKIGGYKFITNKGEFVRNKLEKDAADLLYALNIPYEYEPLIKSENRYFFPDFVIKNKIILECTSWRGEIKAYKLRDKTKFLKKRYSVFVLIPKDLYSYYRILDNHLILGLDELASVAQTFLAENGKRKEQQVEHATVRSRPTSVGPYGNRRVRGSSPLRGVL